MKSLIFILQLLVMSETLQAENFRQDLFLPQFVMMDDAIELTVLSSGCTKKSDFSIVINEVTLSITRLRQDRCRARVRPIKLIFSFEELGIKSVKTTP